MLYIKLSVSLYGLSWWHSGKMPAVFTVPITQLGKMVYLMISLLQISYNERIFEIG